MAPRVSARSWRKTLRQQRMRRRSRASRGPKPSMSPCDSADDCRGTRRLILRWRAFLKSGAGGAPTSPISLSTRLARTSETRRMISCYLLLPIPSSRSSMSRRTGILRRWRSRCSLPSEACSLRMGARSLRISLSSVWLRFFSTGLSGYHGKIFISAKQKAGSGILTNSQDLVSLGTRDTIERGTRQ